MITLPIEKLVFGGQALAKANGQTYFVWNALPNELVDAEIIHEKKDVAEAVTISIRKASPDRIVPTEDHFLSCSPWQILTEKAEDEWKTIIARETYQKIGKLSIPPELSIVSDHNLFFGYRNKMEYAFTNDKSGAISLAAFRRQSKDHVPISSCVLANDAISQSAKNIAAWLNQNKIDINKLITLVIASGSDRNCSAVLYVAQPIHCDTFTLSRSLVGFRVNHVKDETEVLKAEIIAYQAGIEILTTSVFGTDLLHNTSAFFQINVPIFEKVVAEVATYLDKSCEVVDYYSGVGAISLPLHQSYKQATLVEINSNGAKNATKNIRKNYITNAEVVPTSVEKALEFISRDKIIIVDPPRAGLHSKVVQALIRHKPKRIIYLSCNVSTQARDIGLLQDAYNISIVKLYNFFPRTPHIESLCVLDKKR